MAETHFVYFMRAIGADYVKIGITHEPEARLRNVQHRAPFELKVEGLITGDKQDERALHKRFAHRRTHGEWFRYSGDIEAFLASNPSVIRPTYRRPGTGTRDRGRWAKEQALIAKVYHSIPRKS